MISSAPSLMALSAASRAPSGVPFVSLGTSDTFGLSKSNKASSAACFNAVATAGVEPDDVTGRRSATFTAPVDPVKLAPPGPPPPAPGAPQATSIAAIMPASAIFTAAKRPMLDESRIVFWLVGGGVRRPAPPVGSRDRKPLGFARERVRNDGPIMMDEARLYHVTFERLGRGRPSQRKLSRWLGPQKGGHGACKTIATKNRRKHTTTARWFARARCSPT